MKITLSHVVYGDNIEELVNIAQRDCIAYVGMNNVYGFKIVRIDATTEQVTYSKAQLIGHVEVEYFVDPIF